MLNRRQGILLAIFALCWVLVGIGLAGSEVPSLPRSMSSGVGATGIVGVAFFIPGVLLYGMLRRDRLASARSRAVAIQWRWRLALGGGWAVLVGGSLVYGSAQFRIAGAVALLWGILCLAILGLSFRPPR